MTAIAKLRTATLDRQSIRQLADWLVVGVGIALPWSTSATSILIAAWLVAVLLTFDPPAVRRELMTAAGGLPVALWLLALVGMAWADVSVRERLSGFDGFQRLLAIPLLLEQFRRSDHGFRVFCGFLLSASVVLLVSWAIFIYDVLFYAGRSGVPVKDYILQSEEFLICAFGLLGFAAMELQRHRRGLAGALAALAMVFLANIMFVVSGRSVLLAVPVLVLLFGWRQYRWKGLIGACIVFAVLVAIGFESPYLHKRMVKSINELQAYQTSDAYNSTALHLEFLKKSVSFVETAPVIGHGTGSIPELFRKAAAGKTGAAGVVSVNPHNQILAVAIQLGLVGVAVLIAMWVAHLALFRGGGLAAWIGLTVVVQNVVSSLFNSHLFDFTQGWIYVFAVGVAGGMVLRKQGVAGAPAGHGGDPNGSNRNGTDPTAG